MRENDKEGIGIGKGEVWKTLQRGQDEGRRREKVDGLKGGYAARICLKEWK